MIIRKTYITKNTSPQTPTNQYPSLSWNKTSCKNKHAQVVPNARNAAKRHHLKTWNSSNVSFLSLISGAPKTRVLQLICYKRFILDIY